MPQTPSNPVVKGDHVFRIVDDNRVPKGDGKGGFELAGVAGGKAPFGENVVYLSAAILNKKPALVGAFAGTGISADGYSTLERTAAHEVGHSANLLHSEIGAEDGNLMHQSTEPNAGYKITADHIRLILQSFKDGLLNRGKQAIY